MSTTAHTLEYLHNPKPEASPGLAARLLRVLRRNAIFAVAIVPAVAIPVAFFLWTSSAQAAAPTTIECQHPVTTGQAIYDLQGVRASTACPLVRTLGTWESKPGNAAKLYRCGGPNDRGPKLERTTFQGWGLSIGKNGTFQMSRGSSSFAVTGTDFPLNCS